MAETTDSTAGAPPAPEPEAPDEDDELEGRDTDGPDDKLPDWVCRACMGTGIRNGVTCPLCKGTGGIRPDAPARKPPKPPKMPRGAPHWWCKGCAGQGKDANGQPCVSCEGTGGVPFPAPLPAT